MDGLSSDPDRPTRDGGGYWLVAADGGVFALGAAPYLGSQVGSTPPGPVTSLVATPDGQG
jgi:hypothetical protein